MEDKTQKQAAEERRRKLDGWRIAQAIRHIADDAEKGIPSGEGLLKTVARRCGFELEIKENGALEASETVHPERPKPSIEECIDDMNLNYEDIFRDYTTGSESKLMAHIEASTEPYTKRFNALLDEVKGCLSADTPEEKRCELLRDLDLAFWDAIYSPGVERSYLLFGVAAGMKLSGLEPDEVKARMKWLL